MMMAHDSSAPPPRRLDQETVESLREALRKYLSNGQTPSPLQNALQIVAAEAKDKGLLAEQLLVVLKDVWNGLPQVQAIKDKGEEIRALQRVVTMCIKEYYTV